jgi:K+-transporting ATPase c subunit|tara:strand:- start:456 stop:656 length:201 start_codon:yes stop_codon:yes gene_type:complete
MILVKLTQQTWFISYNADKSIIHYGGSPVGGSILSGQQFQDPLYYNEAEWIARLAELGITPDTPPE